MQQVGDFVLGLHKKYCKHAGPNYEETELIQTLDEMNKINLAKPKEERIHFPRDEIKSKEDMTVAQMEFYLKTRQERDQ